MQFPSYVLLEVPTWDKLQVAICRLYFVKLRFFHEKCDRGIKYIVVMNNIILMHIFTFSHGIHYKSHMKIGKMF